LWAIQIRQVPGLNERDLAHHTGLQVGAKFTGEFIGAAGTAATVGATAFDLLYPSSVCCSKLDLHAKMSAISVGPSGCLVLLLLASALAGLGCIEFWKIKNREAAFLSWVWGGLIAIPWLICSISSNLSEFIVVVGVLLAVAFFRWWQVRQKPKSGP
jgi:hypothetical protein